MKRIVKVWAGVCGMMLALTACQTASNLSSPEAELAKRITVTHCVIGTTDGTHFSDPSKIDVSGVWVHSLTERQDDWMAADLSFKAVRGNIYFNTRTGEVACGTDNWRRGLESRKANPFPISGLIGANTIMNRSLAVKWEGYAELFSGVITETMTNKGGTVSVILPRNEGTCSGSFTYTDMPKGTWEIACTNDLKASGTFTAFGEGKGASGGGLDSQGRKVSYTIGGSL